VRNTGVKKRVAPTKLKSPKTRSASAAPAATRHLSADQQRAMELGAEAEHATGQRRESLTRAAKRLGESR